MSGFIPPFEWQRVMVQPWTEDFMVSFWIVVMGFLVVATCGLVGTYLLLRRMALVGDAISHSILFGLNDGDVCRGGGHGPPDGGHH